MKIKHISAWASLALLVTLILSSAAYAAASKTINTAKGQLHKDYFAIPVSVALKAGYAFVKTEGGVADAAKKVSLDAAAINMPFDKLLAEISAGCLNKQKMSVKSRSSFIWNGDRAELLKIFQTSGKLTIGKWVLVVDRGENLCWMISGLYDAADQKTGEAVLAMIKSSWWTRSEVETLSPPLLGSVSTMRTPFKIAGFRQGALIYTKDGSIPTKEADQALFVISSLQRSCATADMRAEFAKKNITEVERDAKLEIISQSAETIAGLPAVVTVAYTNGTPQSLVYQATLFKNSSVIMLVGIARQNTAKNLEIFHKLTASYKED